ncbi:Variable outer membrane protein [Borrelia duttonii CR2A]|uniref:Variable large protein n=1 Tax=Borrelia duttonii CR2A TaxID=1432657 RepID=W6TVX8_9SPIR|nr:Variable outer membrane protein [Borrelia duttonii CR2A]
MFLCSFGDMITGTLGIKADTKKSEIGKYFGDIEKTMISVKEKLNKVVADNDNYSELKKSVNIFVEQIDKIALGAKEAASGVAGDVAIGNAEAGKDAVPAKVESVNSLVKGIKAIVEVVLKKQGNADATKTANSEHKTIGKLLGNNASDGIESEAAATSASIGAISGADILQAIAKSDNVVSGVTIANAKSAADIAAAQKATSDFGDTLKDKDAIIAAGIALRAMAKDGKFVAKTGENKSAYAINGAIASAVNKVLSTLIMAIRNTVDSGLKEINKVLGEIKQGEGAVAKVNE